jgi:hypothetical protein
MTAVRNSNRAMDPRVNQTMSEGQTKSPDLLGVHYSAERAGEKGGNP